MPDLNIVNLKILQISRIILGFEEEDGRTSNWTSTSQQQDIFGVSDDSYEGDYSMQIYKDNQNNNWYHHHAVSTDLLITGNNPT